MLHAQYRLETCKSTDCLFRQQSPLMRSRLLQRPPARVGLHRMDSLMIARTTRKAARIVKVWEEFKTRRRINLFLHPQLPFREQAGNWYDCLHRSRGGPERAGKDASEDPDYFFVRSSPRILFVRQVSSRETLGTLCQFLVVLIVLT